jgi:hypothetical protein
MIIPYKFLRPSIHDNNIIQSYMSYMDVMKYVIYCNVFIYLSIFYAIQ